MILRRQQYVDYQNSKTQKCICKKCHYQCASMKHVCICDKMYDVSLCNSDCHSCVCHLSYYRWGKCNNCLSIQHTCMCQQSASQCRSLDHICTCCASQCKSIKDHICTCQQSVLQCRKIKDHICTCCVSQCKSIKDHICTCCASQCKSIKDHICTCYVSQCRSLDHICTCCASQCKSVKDHVCTCCISQCRNTKDHNCICIYGIENICKGQIHECTCITQGVKCLSDVHFIFQRCINQQPDDCIICVKEIEYRYMCQKRCRFPCCKLCIKKIQKCPYHSEN